MEFKEGTFKAKLITIGRKSGNKHAVELRVVFYKDRFYFSRRNPNSDWLKNSLANPEVEIEYQGNIFRGFAKLVDDQDMCKIVSRMKYSDKRSEDSRIVLEVIPCE